MNKSKYLNTKKIKKLMKKEKLTMNELGSRLAKPISKQAILSILQTGSSSLSTVIGIAAVLRVKIDDIIKK